MVQYWLDLFTPETWKEAKAASYKITGFRESRWSLVSKIQPNDILICYVTKVSRFCGLLKVRGKPFKDPTRAKKIWKTDDFPCIMKVEPIITLDLGHSVPSDQVIRNLSIASKWGGIVRGSPNRIPLSDGITISKILQNSVNRNILYPLKIKYTQFNIKGASKPFSNRGLYGNPIDFRGLRHEPINEQGVVYLFALIAKDLGFRVEAIGTAFPDCEAMIQIGHTGKWKRTYIEFELHSSDFKRHGHQVSGCEYIVCWKHDWKNCPLQVIELSEEITKLTNK